MSGMRSLPIPDVKVLLDRLPVKYAALGAIGVACGCRVSEITRLRRFDLLDADGKLRDELQLYKFKAKPKAKKRGRPKKSEALFARPEWRLGIPGRKLPLPEKLRKYVLRQLQREAELGYDRPDDLVFRGKGNLPLSRFTVYRVFRLTLGVGYGTHWMRKTFAQEIYRRFLAQHDPIDALDQTRQALGHSRLETTILYLGLHDAEVRSAQDEIFAEF